MDNRGLFVDFMYAVTVGATMTRLDDKVLHWGNSLLWALIFLIAVFLEDFYLYHVKVVPHLQSFPNWRGFLLAMLIIGIWFLGQASFPSNTTLFLISFASFFLLKLLGGFLMRVTPYPSKKDAVFLFPAMTAIALLFISECLASEAHPGRLLMVLAPVWLVTVVIWWSIDSQAAVAPSVEAISTPKT
jgi:hypothetical protein